MNVFAEIFPDSKDVNFPIFPDSKDVNFPEFFPENRRPVFVRIT